MFNDKKSLSALRSFISFSNILDAEVINFTTESLNNINLIRKIESNPVAYNFLDYDKYSINTLYYLKKVIYMIVIHV